MSPALQTPITAQD